MSLVLHDATDTEISPEWIDGSVRCVYEPDTNADDPTLVPFEERSWQLADQRIAAAGAASMHVELGLGDYRNTLWNDCINPYTYDWTRYIDWVAHRVNTVTGAVYGSDPAIAFVSISGEPLRICRNDSVPS